MSNIQKPIFKIVDERGRVTIPKAMREAHGIASGDVVTITAERGTVRVKKAIVLEDNHLTAEAKSCYVQAAVREMDDTDLTELLGLTARVMQERKVGFGISER